MNKPYLSAETAVPRCSLALLQTAPCCVCEVKRPLVVYTSYSCISIDDSGPPNCKETFRRDCAAHPGCFCHDTFLSIRLQRIGAAERQRCQMSSDATKACLFMLTYSLLRTQGFLHEYPSASQWPCRTSFCNTAGESLFMAMR